MTPSIVVLTCDRYRPYWGGFWHFMERQWDFGIKSQIFFCNEEEKVDVPRWCTPIKTGKGTFVENLKRALEIVGSEEIFLMLEDFWPIAPMRMEMFESLYGHFKSSGWDALQVSNYTPYYKVIPTEMDFADSKVLEFETDSEWLFNFQARFWRSDSLLKFLSEPDIPEGNVSSAITVEIASDRRARESGVMKAGLYHYLWYPMSGVSYRGEMTDFGRHLQNIFEVDRFVETMFSQPVASRSLR